MYVIGKKRSKHELKTYIFIKSTKRMLAQKTLACTVEWNHMNNINTSKHTFTFLLMIIFCFVKNCSTTPEEYGYSYSLLKVFITLLKSNIWVQLRFHAPLHLQIEKNCLLTTCDEILDRPYLNIFHLKI